MAKSERLRSLGGNAGKRPPPTPSQPTPAAIARAEALEAFGDQLLTSARGQSKAWREDVKTALQCFDAAGKIRYRAAAAPPVITPAGEAGDSYEQLLTARETAARR